MKSNYLKIFSMLFSIVFIANSFLVGSSRKGRQLSKKVKQTIANKKTRITKSKASELKTEVKAPEALPIVVKKEELLLTPAPAAVEKKQAEHKLEPLNEKELNEEIEELETVEQQSTNEQESSMDSAIKTASTWAISAFDTAVAFGQLLWTWTRDVAFVKIVEMKNWVSNQTSCSSGCSCHNHN